MGFNFALLLEIIFDAILFSVAQQKSS